MNEATASKTDIKVGYFVAFADEAEELKKSKLVTTGRAGVYYKKEDLVSTIESNKALDGKKMNIVKIQVDPCAIISPNCIKFGIKCGKGIPIISIQSFTSAKKEIKEMAIA